MYRLYNLPDYSGQPIFGNLSPNRYKLIVRDASNCLTAKEVELIQSQSPTVASTNVVATSCGQANGSITITATGGVKPLQYSLDSINFQPGGSFTQVKSGQYQAVVVDSVGCASGVALRVAPSRAPVIDSLSITESSCGEQSGSLTVHATGSSVLSYSVDSTDFQSQPLFTAMKADTYSVYVKDGQGCITKTASLVDEDCSESVNMPNAFSPNNDGLNDTWTIHFKQAKINVLTLTVFNRWGEVVYHRKNFPIASGHTLWDGSINVLTGPTGLFAYVLEIQLDKKRRYTYNGTIHLIR